MKTKDELNQLKQEYESLATKLNELTDDELAVVSGGNDGYGLTRKPVEHIVKPLKDAEKQIASFKDK